MTKNANIDILPMACVGLLLVVMMIMTAPLMMTHSNIPVDVPKTHTAERKTEEELVIAYTVDNKLYLNDQAIQKSDLEDRLCELLTEDQYCLVVIRADKEVLHKDVLELIAIAKRAGATRIACATKKVRE